MNNAANQQIFSNLVHLNKFEVLSDLTQPEMAPPPKPKESDRIQNLEASLKKLSQEKQQWLSKEKKLEAEKSDLAAKYDDLKKVSDSRNLELQRQIDELVLRMGQIDNASQARKRPRTQGSTVTTPLPSSTSSSTVNESAAMETDHSDLPANKPKPATSERPPPIFVYGITDYAAFAQFLKTHKVDNCTRKETNSSLILTTQTAEHFRALHKVLRTECTTQSGKDSFGTLQLHSYQLKSERAFVIFFRGLPGTMNTDDIGEALVELHFTPR